MVLFLAFSLYTCASFHRLNFYSKSDYFFKNHFLIDFRNKKSSEIIFLSLPEKIFFFLPKKLLSSIKFEFV